jgi:hypothetical protein
VKIKKYKTGIFACSFVWVRNLVLTLKEVKLKVFENRVHRGIFCRNKGEIPGGWGRVNNEGFINCILHKIQLGR